MLNTLNQKIFFFINHSALEFPVLDGFMVFVSRLLVQALMLLVFAWLIFLAVKSKRDSSLFLKKLGDVVIFFITLSFVWAITELIKGLVSLPRPHQTLEDAKTLLVHGSNDSFPSLHTSFSFAIAYFVYSLSKRAGLMLFGIALIVGVSRIYVGVHYPLDVIAGAFVGVLIAFVIIKVFKK
ncbi:MAG TPA: phosphatase PAP2 family protein [Candidatus Paceibacterota bacterium]|nr:phosphatase PAP2 family protein [Candidatus Paceibacterota bacterium]